MALITIHYRLSPIQTQAKSYLSPFRIAKYLDQKYPSIKVLSGDGSGEEEAAFKAQQQGHDVDARPLCHGVHLPCAERTQARFGKKLEDLAPLEKRPALLEAIHQGLSKGITYIIIASGLTWVKTVLPADEHGTIVGWDEGRWGNFMEHFERFQKAS